MRARTTSPTECCLWGEVINNTIFIRYNFSMKKNIALLLFIVAAFLIYTLLNDRLTWESEKVMNDDIITGSVETASISSSSSMTGFQASGVEPFWWAEFSGSTLSRNAVDYSGIVITGFVGPTISGAISIRNHTWTNTVITITSGSYTHDMSGNPCNGAISLILSWQTWNWFVGCS